MSLNDKISGKEIIIGVAILTIVAIGMYVTLGFFKAEGAKTSAVISDKGSKNPNRVEASMTLLGLDAVKGDATARIEFAPKGNLFNEDDNTLKQNIRFYINSANGKQEIDFAKGKRMTPVEAVINTYDGNVSDYPFDTHKAEVELYLAPGKEDPKKAAEKPASGEEPANAKKEDAEPEDIPITVDFYGSLPGYKITTQVSKETDENYALFDLNFERSSTAIFFSIFIAVVMWALSIAVLFLILSVVIRKRKPELAMFSFMAALLFAFYAVRNSQPNVPAIGVFSDFVSFFWAELIVAACLLIGVFTWIFRPAK